MPFFSAPENQESRKKGGAKQVMKRRIRVRGVRRKNVDLDKLAFALLRLVEQLSPTEREQLRATRKPVGDESADDPATGSAS